MEAKLKENGWFLSSEGIAECERVCNKDKPSLQEMSRAALNLDLKQYGIKHLPDDINRGKVQEVTGPMILQVQKLRNISAPKANEESIHAPRLLKIQLTDGHLTCHGLENSTIPDLSLSIPPGTKISLTGTITVKENILMLDSNNTKVLGGEVEKLKEKWELNKTLAKHSRMAVSGDGPPPFVPFGQGLQTGSDSKGRPSDNTKVNGIVQSSAEKPRNHQSKDSNPSSKARSFDSSRNNRPINHDHRDSGYKKINNNNNNNNGQDSRVEDRRGTGDKTNNRFTAEERTSLTHSKEKEGRSVNSEAANKDRSRQGFNPTDENRNNSRTERSERSEKSQSRTQEPSRGGGRLRGRGGRRDSGGRLRGENEDVDDVEDYRSRQPSEPALWDFLSTKFPAVKDTKNEKPLKSIENQKTDEGQQERPPPRPPPKPDNDFKPRQQKQDPRVEKSENASPPRQLQGDGQGEYATPRAVEKQRQESSAQHRDGRQQGKPQREPYYKQQQNAGQTKGKGSRRHDHDSRPYNQSLPPRLQKKQQQQQQQRQHHQHYQHHNQHQTETDVSNDVAETNATSTPSVAQEDDAIITFSTAPALRQAEYVEEPPSQMSPQVQFQEPQGVPYSGPQFAGSGGQGKWQRNTEHYRRTSFTPPNVQQQQQQHLEFVSMAMETQRSQAAQFVMGQTQPYLEQGGQEQADMNLVQEYQYAQQTQPPVQAYPVYQLRPAQLPQQQMIPQQTIPQQPVAAPMAATQVGWKKGDHCLAPWRDGQYYSAKMEDLMPDGVNCVVSFLDFHNSCDVVPLSSLRPFPIIAWGDSGNSQPQPTGAIATVPYYTQATPVNIVSRPQMVIPVSGQPPFHAGTRPTFVHSAQVPPQVHWQPATMQYQEVRPAAFQPIMHYSVPQTSAGGPGQVPYGVPTGGGMHYVRGVKDIQGQDVYSSNPEGGRGRSSPTSSGYSKPRRPNRATQSYYVPPRQQKYKDKG